MVYTCRYLAPDVFYHNMPWEPVVGHAAVRKLLDPLVQAPNCALRKMDIPYTTCTGNVVMNARLETWTRRNVQVELPVAGLFVIENQVITRWCDCWDLKTIQPLLAKLEE
jgi:limonene-1,2-epoxide hydrolase